jgi:hypothetical protein
VAEPLEDGEIFDSDDDDLPTLRQILGPLELPKQVVEMINLTCDGDGDSGRRRQSYRGKLAQIHSDAHHRVTLTSPSLTDHFRVADQLPLPPTVLSAKLTGVHSRRPHNVIYSGYTWQEETPFHQCPSVVPIAPQTSTAFRQA